MTFEEELKIAEFEQINFHLRNLYDNVLRLAQLSMVVNPALGVAFAYVWIYRYGRLGNALQAPSGPMQLSPELNKALVLLL
jgi:hypothetical protein